MIELLPELFPGEGFIGFMAYYYRVIINLPTHRKEQPSDSYQGRNKFSSGHWKESHQWYGPDNLAKSTNRHCCECSRGGTFGSSYFPFQWNCIKWTILITTVGAWQ